MRRKCHAVSRGVTSLGCFVSDPIGMALAILACHMGSRPDLLERADEFALDSLTFYKGFPKDRKLKCRAFNFCVVQLGVGELPCREARPIDGRVHRKTRNGGGGNRRGCRVARAHAERKDCHRSAVCCPKLMSFDASLELLSPPPEEPRRSEVNHFRPHYFYFLLLTLDHQFISSD